MSVIEIRDAGKPANVAEIIVEADKKNPRKARWKSRSPGAFWENSTSRDWQPASVQFSKDSNDQTYGEVTCYVTSGDDSNAYPCFTLYNCFHQGYGLEFTEGSGDGQINERRPGFLSAGDMTWRWMF
jgi:hypothetical protein